tara:strand:+ start:185 stop:499 length:315 start_codon:yes stop_codon:yes gene_type:complete
MSWKDMIRKESMARDLSEMYGPDYIDRLTSMNAKYRDEVILEADGESLEVDLDQLESAKRELPYYDGRIKQYLERVISEHRGQISRETLKIAEELDIDISPASF